jgi:hypothetical protein
MGCPYGILRFYDPLGWMGMGSSLKITLNVNVTVQKNHNHLVHHLENLRSHANVLSIQSAKHLWGRAVFIYWLKLLHHHLKLTRFHLQHTTGNKSAYWGSRWTLRIFFRVITYSRNDANSKMFSIQYIVLRYVPASSSVSFNAWLQRRDTQFY